MEDELIKIFTGENDDDINFAFEIVQSEAGANNINYNNFIEKLIKSKKWKKGKRFGLDTISRIHIDTTYTFLVKKEDISELKQQLLENENIDN